MKKFLLFIILFCFTGMAALSYQFPRWKFFPLKVYIEPHNKALIVKNAFENWTTSTNNMTKFMYVNTTAKHPNIIVKFSEVNNNPNEGFENAIGVTHSFTPYGFFATANVTIYLTHPGGKTYLNDDELYAVSLHEIGHALGLKHSNLPEDIMFPVMHGQRSLTANDIKRMYLIYKH